MVGYISSLGSALGMNTDQTEGAIGGGGSLVGLGLSIFGTMGQVSAAKKEADISQQEAQTEMQMDKTRQQMMNIDVNRRMIQAQRNAEAARATSRAANVNQGGSAMAGQMSSGAAGGVAQETAQGAYNLLGLSQDWQIGTQMFGLTQQLDQQKIQMAQAQSAAATAQGWSNIGGAIASQAGNFAKLAMLV